MGVVDNILGRLKAESETYRYNALDPFHLIKTIKGKKLHNYYIVVWAGEREYGNIIYKIWVAKYPKKWNFERNAVWDNAPDSSFTFYIIEEWKLKKLDDMFYKTLQAVIFKYEKIAERE